jgi:hypothetical protein
MAAGRRWHGFLVRLAALMILVAILPSAAGKVRREWYGGPLGRPIDALAGSLYVSMSLDLSVPACVKQFQLLRLFFTSLFVWSICESLSRACLCSVWVTASPLLLTALLGRDFQNVSVSIYLPLQTAGSVRSPPHRHSIIVLTGLLSFL